MRPRVSVRVTVIGYVVAAVDGGGNALILEYIASIERKVGLYGSLIDAETVYPELGLTIVFNR